MTITEYIARHYKIEPGRNTMRFHRRDMIDMFNAVGYKTGVEIGVNNGRFAQYMCERIPDLKYYGIDPYNRYDDFRIASTSAMQHSYRKAAAKLTPFDAEIIPTFSALAYSRFENESIDFVYIDGNHSFNYVLMDILLWLPKIRKGGVISGHDYSDKPNEATDVKAAVDFCIKSFRVQQWFLLRDTSWLWSVE